MSSESSPYSVGELLLLEAGEPREAHLEDGLRLALGEEVRALRFGGVDLVLGAAGAAHERLEPRERERHEGRSCAASGSATARMVFDDEVDVGDRHAQAFDDLALGLGLAQLEAGAARDDVAAVLDEAAERLLEVEDGGAAVDDGEVDDAEATSADRSAGRAGSGRPAGSTSFFSSMTRRMPSRSRLVAHLADALDALLAHQLADLRVHPRLVHLVGDLGDDELLALALPGDLLDRGCARA